MMKSAKRFIKLSGISLAAILIISSCKKFSVLNTNPNSLTLTAATPDYLMANVLTSTAMRYGNMGSGDLSGAIQHTVADAWGTSYSEYQWDPQDWSGYYNSLRDNKLMLSIAKSDGWNFHQGVGLIMRAFNYGVIADFWGDAPDSMALNGDQNGAANEYPTFDSQQSIYARVIADLKAAIPLLTGTMADHPEITGLTQTEDVFYAGDPTKWTKLANSLLLRYYLRLSGKMDVQADVEAIAANVFQSNADDWAMPFPGTDNSNSYQKNSQFNGASNFDRYKMCATLVKRLDTLKDPRIVIMADPIGTASKVDASKFAPGDNTTLTTIVGGVRYINPAAAAAGLYKEFNQSTYAVDRPYGAPLATVWNFFDTSPTYVGIPISYSYNDFLYNINGAGTQANSNNVYVSYMRKDIYSNTSGPLLAQRMASYNEICFDLAEAALKGWNVGGTATDWYNKGIQASFDLWQVFSTYQSDVNGYAGCVKDYATYIAQPTVAFNGTLQRIMEQKWIAAWQASTESYLDWRRTGYPDLHVGWGSYRQQIPLRYAYASNELQNNTTNSDAAIALLQGTSYGTPDGLNSSWSKFWLLQGTGLPW